MKDLNYLNKYRKELFKGNLGDEHNGVFLIPIENKNFFVIASDGMDWEHVSVSINNVDRCPKWNEMCKIKEMFFEDDEVVMQLHPKKSEYVNLHEYTLHLWRPINQKIPTPSKIMV
jgi:hypothetical protein